MRARTTQLNALPVSSETRPDTGRGRNSRRERPFLWFAPVILLLLAVTLYPTALVIWISFQKTRFYALEGFVGLANYGTVLFSSQFIQVSVNSLLYVLCSLAAVLPLGLASALLLQSLGRLGTALRVALLVPWTLSMAVVGAFWIWILNPSYGLLSYALDSLGIEPGLMLGDPSMALWLLVLVTAWWSFSYATVMMAAAVQSVPRELHEAVSIDGGGSVARLVHVTWPHLAPTMGSTALALSITYLTLITRRFLRFMISPEAQAIAAEGGEVVSRASAYSADYFNSPAAADQKQWAELIRSRGREVQYTPILTTFHQIIGDAFQRMILANGTPEAAYDEVVKAYNAALAKSR
jgi:multiple sugar transport system permease protein